jgi:hypothetical protein
MREMEVTAVQRRTLDALIGARHRPSVASDLHVRLRDRLEAAVRSSESPEPLLLTKSRLNDAARCEGRFLAALRREAPPFEHGARTAGGLLLHKAIELDVGGREERDAHALAELAAERLEAADESFARYWRSSDPVSRDELLMRGTAAIVCFRETFPPLRSLRSQLVPLVEWRLRTELSGGALVLDGRVDLSLGRQDASSARLLIDLKADGARPEHVEDMRFYALVHLLRFGAAPSRVATVFLSSGEWQAEDVDETILDHAAGRVVAAVRSASALRRGRAPDLAPGPYCSWCPRAGSCPAASLGDSAYAC